jgi:hypothetical protein
MLRRDISINLLINYRKDEKIFRKDYVLEGKVIKVWGCSVLILNFLKKTTRWKKKK